MGFSAGGIRIAAELGPHFVRRARVRSIVVRVTGAHKRKGPVATNIARRRAVAIHLSGEQLTDHHRLGSSVGEITHRTGQLVPERAAILQFVVRPVTKTATD